MKRRGWFRHVGPPALAAFAVNGLLFLSILLLPGATLLYWREGAIDLLLASSQPPPSDKIRVVEIDSASLDALGPWPWPRERLAQAIERLTDDGARAIGIDLLLSGPDRADPQTLAKALADATARPDVAALVATLPSPDQRLATAMARIPTVLGFVLTGTPATHAPLAPPILARTRPSRLDPWQGVGGEFPAELFETAIAGLGAISLGGDVEGRVRTVPLLVATGEDLRPGLALEMMRLAVNAGAFILNDQKLLVGNQSLPLTPTAEARFRPGTPERWRARSVSLIDVIERRVPPAWIKDHLVLIGSSTPEIGGLRPTIADPLTPTVQIEADALATMLAGRVPFRPGWMPRLEIAVAFCLIVLAIIFAIVLPPLAAAGLSLLTAIAWTLVAALGLASFDLAFDPVTPGLTGLAAAIAAGLMQWSLARQRAATLRRRFERYLAPDVVRSIIDNPQLVRLEPERREVTALFTDIEDFTATTDHLNPTDLIKILDLYFEGVTALIIEHGGMVDKFVGDAVIALFNVPVDLPDHPRKAVACAQAIIAYTEAFRLRPDIRAKALGRTRIGIESGTAIVGEVGLGARLDYTAYGNVVNTAARLEAANKTFGTSICVGAACRARIPSNRFRSLGLLAVRGLGQVEVFEPLPDGSHH